MGREAPLAESVEARDCVDDLLAALRLGRAGPFSLRVHCPVWQGLAASGAFPNAHIKSGLRISVQALFANIIEASESIEARSDVIFTVLENSLHLMSMSGGKLSGKFPGTGPVISSLPPGCKQLKASALKWKKTS
ncbi:MAG TPA: hypothetical protein VN822_07595 [Candidatus Acidoferrales bacterium]|nr:hypothetical protein [Candidatus Acidoferrales bacterium]